MTSNLRLAIISAIFLLHQLLIVDRLSVSYLSMGLSKAKMTIVILP